MSQTEQRCDCACDHSPFTMLPVRGFGIAVDTSGLLPAPAPKKLCRERVDHDVDIYINGNLEMSGDGLTPESAVKSYGDAVLALSRYDGCNLYNAHFHFADLADPEALYPDFDLKRGHYSTFAHLYVSGESHTTTCCGTCTVRGGSVVTISNVCMTCFQSVTANLYINGNISIKPKDRQYGIVSRYGGTIVFENGTNAYFMSGNYSNCLYSNSSVICHNGNVAFHTVGSVNVTHGFVYCECNGTIHFYNTVDFTGCTSVTGKKYQAVGLSCICTGGKTLPGTEPGVLKSGSVCI